MTEEGIEIDFISSQHLNALSPIVVNFESSENEIISRFEQKTNALFPIDSTEEGIEIDFNFPHC